MKPKDKENFVNVQYLDNHILVLIKEADLLTQSTKNKLVSLETNAKKWLKDKYKKKGKVFLNPIHRLDKEVAGLVLFARTSKALSRLNEQMRENKIIRKYIAQVEGKLQEEQKELKNYIVHLSHRAKIVKKNQKNSKLAHLSYKLLKEKKDSSIIEIQLFTGRYHQIRAQMSNLGHPIIGDKKYNSKKKLNKIFLQCYYLKFFHPITKKEIKIKIKPFFE